MCTLTTPNLKRPCSPWRRGLLRVQSQCGGIVYCSIPLDGQNDVHVHPYPTPVGYVFETMGRSFISEGVSILRGDGGDDHLQHERILAYPLWLLLTMADNLLD